eukprot:CFRG1129T1
MANRSNDFPPCRSTRLLSWPGRVSDSVSVDDHYDEIKIRNILAHVRDWNFDVFELNALTKGRALETLGYTIFEDMGWMSTFGIDAITLRTFLKTLANGYRRDNPFHNALHAADVTHAVYYFVNCSGLTNVLSELEKCSVVIAAIIHDVDHPGVNNAFLERSNDLICKIHGNQGPLERHHLNAGLDVLSGCNLLANMNSKDRAYATNVVRELVLATDMARHGEFMKEFDSLLEDGVDWSIKDDTRLLILQLLMKCADINNSARPETSMERWACMVMDEFFNQGDAEKGLMMEVSKGFDRETTSIPTVQAGFIGICVQPLFEALGNLVKCEEIRIPVQLLTNNLEKWKKKQVEASLRRELENCR